ncbi:BlaI/MecI/CopY family transcriptional regulator [Paenibacillus sp. B01]|uniref:BlaI/MecI/CopY family transcriptional regulator n=1 Tax=Paenibacillus sp. B01 TaxID=2660554 RepID=UPI00129AA917|nr:BlaI/MecI/CopY family transcriptional regulator [Paenibacillus sp. B01]QGG55043.1 BlaI/MecI/CopY family transcriptional regulator [Paenibacillus sp. B01]
MRINKYNVNEEGLHRFFGSLEAKIMEIIWQKEKLTIKQLHEIINQEDPISLTAVMTVMIRLAEKGHLRKETSGGGRNKLTFFYPVQNKDQFIMEQTKAVTEGLFQDFDALIVSHFLDRIDQVDSLLIDKLRDKLSELDDRNEGNHD